MTQPNLRQILSDELHPCAFHDFDGAVRLIRFVYLINDNAAAFRDYVNAFVERAKYPQIATESKFAR